MTNYCDDYESVFRDFLEPLSIRLKDHFVNLLEDVQRIDNISSRAKDPSSFRKKAQKVDDRGNLKYHQPRTQIQDQIGVRVTVLYLKDVLCVKDIIEDYFASIEYQDKAPESDFEFGYVGSHYLLKIPEDVIDDGTDDIVPEFFELQIKTLFQHAWSEASHDVGYKAPRSLTPLERRQLAFSAAQAWGADQIFQQLSAELNAAND
ncbi:GTP pyrophosphokinase [Croceibacterium ferulae]|uniref:GTP pyrophosphokinase n=1 Tax=Croceibacterium ferulae TaxID=1854641 RepID=UPI000EAC6F09|nr:RelA/SpoT domain-containing protein [Croceibacterium ferulae]